MSKTQLSRRRLRRKVTMEIKSVERGNSERQNQTNDCCGVSFVEAETYIVIVKKERKSIFRKGSECRRFTTTG